MNFSSCCYNDIFSMVLVQTIVKFHKQYKPNKNQMQHRKDHTLRKNNTPKSI